MLRKTWPKNMRTKAPTTPFDTAVPNAEKMNGAEIKSPTPQITEKLARFDLIIIFVITYEMVCSSKGEFKHS